MKQKEAGFAHLKNIWCYFSHHIKVGAIFRVRPSMMFFFVVANFSLPTSKMFFSNSPLG